MDQVRELTLGEVLPGHDGLFYGGRWRKSASTGSAPTFNPATGEPLAEVAVASPEDVDECIAEAGDGFREWSRTKPAVRADIMREMATIFRANAPELAFLDSANSGNPARDMVNDVHMAASWFDFYAGLVTEMKGHSIPFGPGSVTYSMREPRGIVARIVAFNHPFMFSAGKMAAPLAAGNSVIVKPPEQAPLSSLRMAELVGHLLPAGAMNILNGGRDVGQTLSEHPDIAMVTLVGSVPTGKAIMQSASSTLKPIILELGGKNALVAFPDASPAKVAEAAIAGMNFGWCGQSCGSTSRLFLHDDIHDAVMAEILDRIARFEPGIPTEFSTTMGSIINARQYERVLGYIEKGKAQGATLAYGGLKPEDPALENGFFIYPAVFTGVTQDMAIASEEIFGPVLSVLRWRDEAEMYRHVNAVDYGLTCSIWTNDLHRAHRAASSVEAGYVWVNRVGTHFLGAPFGGYKQSGIGKENCLQELLSFTREKNVHIEFDEEMIA